MDQQRSQLGVATLAYAQQLNFCAGSCLSGYQTEPRCKLTARLERTGITHGCDSRGRAQQTNAGYFSNRPGCLIFLHPSQQLWFDFKDLLIELGWAFSLFAERIDQHSR
jgi:hypothetical protein